MKKPSTHCNNYRHCATAKAQKEKTRGKPKRPASARKLTHHHVKASSTKSTTAPIPILSLVASLTSSANAPGPQTETSVAPTLPGKTSSRTTAGRHRPENICTVAEGEMISAARRGFDTNNLTTRMSRRPGWRRMESIH